MDEYRAPSSAPLGSTRKPGSPWKAVGLGLLTDIGSTWVVGAVFGTAYAFVLASRGASEDEILQTLAGTTELGWEYALLLVLGCGCSVLGGYVCARIAQPRNYRLGIILAALVSFVGLFLMPTVPQIGLQAVGLVASIGSVLLGTRLGMPDKARDSVGAA